eukprot:m.81238 g.81238  ORF g.81238 m.81238 type:complete len:722 (-) comp25399_c0_seq1:87-2252(-)
MENIAPHSVTLLVLLQEYCRGLFEEINPSGASVPEDEPWCPATRHEISRILVREIQAGAGESKGKELHGILNELASIPNDGQELANLVHDTLMQIKSPEEIFELSDSLRELLLPLSTSKAVLDANSMLGLFIRRTLLAFDKMDFPQISKLYRRIQQYKRNPGNITSRGADDRETNLRHTSSMLLSSSEARQVFQQARELTQKGTSANELKRLLRAPLSSMQHLPLVHYVRHLCCVQSRDFCGALSNLHRYFDLQAANATRESQPSADSKSHSRSLFQHATLSLAALHHRFGNKEEAIHAIKETVKIAQENLDRLCLQHALGWLTRLVEGPSSLELARLFVHDTEANDTKQGQYLHCLAQLTYAKKLFLHGQNTTSVLRIVSSGYSASVQNSVDELMGMSYMLHSGLFDLYGHRNLTMLYAQLHLRNRNPGSAEDGCEAYCKLAAHCFVQGDTTVAYRLLAKAEDLFPPSTPTAVLWLALRWQLDHQQALYAQEWDKVIFLGETLLPKLGFDSSNTDTLYRTALYHIERSQYDDAATLLLNLSVITDDTSESTSVVMPQIKKVRVLLLLAETMLEAHNFTPGLETIEECITLAKKYHLVLYESLAVLMKAEIQLSLGNVVEARKNLYEATPWILSHGSLEDRGRTHLITGKLKLKMDSSQSGLASAIKSFEISHTSFSRLGAKRLDQRSLYCLARAHDLNNDHEKRDDCARLFQNLAQTHAD